MQLGRRQRVHAGSGCLATDPNFGLFSATLTQNAGLNGRITLPEAIAAGRNASCVIRDIQVVSLDANIWEFWFWGNSNFATGDARESFKGSYTFAAAGLQIAATGLYHASASGLDLFYNDEDAETASGPQGRATSNGQIGAYLNVTLVNRSAGAKTAAGWFDVSFICEPTLGW